MAEAKVTDYVTIGNELESSIISFVTPLVTGTIVQKTDEEKAAFSNVCHRLNELVSVIQSGHDKWVREVELETNENSELRTIRKSKKENKGQGFISL